MDRGLSSIVPVVWPCVATRAPWCPWPSTWMPRCWPRVPTIAAPEFGGSRMEFACRVSMAIAPWWLRFGISGKIREVWAWDLGYLHVFACVLVDHTHDIFLVGIGDECWLILSNQLGSTICFSFLGFGHPVSGVSAINNKIVSVANPIVNHLQNHHKQSPIQFVDAKPPLV